MAEFIKEFLWVYPIGDIQQGRILLGEFIEKTDKDISTYNSVPIYSDSSFTVSRSSHIEEVLYAKDADGNLQKFSNEEYDWKNVNHYIEKVISTTQRIKEEILKIDK